MREGCFSSGRLNLLPPVESAIPPRATRASFEFERSKWGSVCTGFCSSSEWASSFPQRLFEVSPSGTRCGRRRSMQTVIASAALVDRS